MTTTRKPSGFERSGGFPYNYTTGGAFIGALPLGLAERVKNPKGKVAARIALAPVVAVGVVAGATVGALMDGGKKLIDTFTPAKPSSKG